MNCLNCKKEYEAKRATSKFCSDKCRVKYNRDHPKERITKVQMQVLYNSILDVLSQHKAELPKDWQNINKVGVLKPNGVVEPVYERPAELQLTFQQHMNKISTLVFPDEKEEYVPIILAATYLSQKQRDLLMANLKMQRG